MVRDVRSYLFLLWGGVGLLLLIGCVNVANLLLVRFTAWRGSWRRGWRWGRPAPV